MKKRYEYEDEWEYIHINGQKILCAKYLISTDGEIKKNPAFLKLKKREEVLLTH